MAEQILIRCAHPSRGHPPGALSPLRFGEAFATSGVVGGDGLFAAVVDIEAGVFPGEEVGEFFRANDLSGREDYLSIHHSLQ